MHHRSFGAIHCAMPRILFAVHRARGGDVGPQNEPRAGDGVRRRAHARGARAAADRADGLG
eukprot:7376089-Prymnesium_polylepis.2